MLNHRMVYFLVLFFVGFFPAGTAISTKNHTFDCIYIIRVLIKRHICLKKSTRSRNPGGAIEH